MGFLDHSTSNIIVDAVLTDIGRQRLASGEFQIDFFSLGDDEVDYGIIKQYGRNVGKEKIEKNTPIFEAQTNHAIAQRHKLIFIDTNAQLTTLPILTVDAANNLVTMKRSASEDSKSINVTIKNTDSQIAIIDSLKDRYIDVEIDSRFISVINQRSPYKRLENNTDIYRIDVSQNVGGSELTSGIQISLKRIIDSDFKKFSRASGDYIRTFIKIVGNVSGAQKIIEVRIS